MNLQNDGMLLDIRFNGSVRTCFLGIRTPKINVQEASEAKACLGKNPIGGRPEGRNLRMCLIVVNVAGNRDRAFQERNGATQAVLGMEAGALNRSVPALLLRTPSWSCNSK